MTCGGLCSVEAGLSRSSSRSAAMSRQQLPGTFINMNEEEKQAYRFVAQPTGQQHYPRSHAAGGEAVPATTLVEVNAQRVPLDKPSTHGLHVYLRPGIIDFPDTLTVLLVVDKDAAWRHPSKEETFTLDVTQVGGPFYTPFKITFVDPASESAAILVVKCQLPPVQPMPSPEALADGVLRFSVSRVSTKGNQTKVAKAYFALNERLYIGAMYPPPKLPGHVVAICGIPGSGKTTTISTAKSVTYNDGRYQSYGVSGGRSEGHEGATTRTETYQVENLAVKDFVPVLSADKPCVFLDLAGCGLAELLRMTRVIFDPQHGLNVQVDLSKAVNRTDEALKESAAVGREYRDEEGLAICKTYVLQASVFFAALSDLFDPPSPAAGVGDEAHRLIYLREKDGARQLCDFWIDVQRTCATYPILVVTKVDHYFPQYRNAVGLLPTEDRLATQITNQIASLLNMPPENVILAAMRPDSPPQDVRHVAFFRCAMAAFWILRKGRLATYTQTVNKADQENQQLNGYVPVQSQGPAVDALEARKARLRALKAEQEAKERAEREAEEARVQAEKDAVLLLARQKADRAAEAKERKAMALADGEARMMRQQEIHDKAANEAAGKKRGLATRIFGFFSPKKPRMDVGAK